MERPLWGCFCCCIVGGDVVVIVTDGFVAIEMLFHNASSCNFHYVSTRRNFKSVSLLRIVSHTANFL